MTTATESRQKETARTEPRPAARAPRPEGLLQAIGEALRRPVRPGRGRWPHPGWMCVVLLVVAGLTGGLLSLYYIPATDAANESVRFIAREVSWGWLVRGIHRWAAHLVVAVGVLQALRVFFTGSYRGGNAGSWVLGGLLLGTTVAIAFTGELLPWDGHARALASEALAGTASLPLVGPPLAGLMRGGPEVGAATLARAHAAHVLVLPWMVFLVLSLELWFRGRSRSSRRELERRNAELQRELEEEAA